ncbi:lymphocyte antigen 6D [Mugil cephalus]|uniref:lymphocyte antigen 6D n=1 Tax=Mugil cephalus TaxID=48193 RepID=UPI001FB7C3EF|nr:lymphocyte antigen 6D [Mugil cephalus]
MKVLLITLLLVLLCSAQVLTLTCYTCENEHDATCKIETDCPTNAAYCKTFQRGNQLSRTCEEFCAEDYYTTCCQGDLCSP